MIGTVISLIGNLICMFASKKLYLLLAAGRFVFGLSLGVISSIGPLYMSEVELLI
jgi:predicted MFS family arabinose efflux permease